MQADFGGAKSMLGTAESEDAQAKAAWKELVKTVVADLKAYKKDTAPADATLKKAEGDWFNKVQANNKAWGEAYEFEMANWKMQKRKGMFPKPVLENKKEVMAKYKAAMQGKEVEDQELYNAILQHHRAVSGDKQTLGDEIKNQWVPLYEKAVQEQEEAHEAAVAKMQADFNGAKAMLTYQ